MTLTHILALAMAMNGCDVQPMVEESIRKDGADVLPATAAEIAQAATEVLALDPTVPCQDRGNLVHAVVAAWLHDGKVMVERPDQVSDFVVRPFGKVELKVSEPVTELTIKTAGQSIHLENGRKIVLAAGPVEFDVYAGSRLICSIAHVVKADQLNEVTCAAPAAESRQTSQ